MAGILIFLFPSLCYDVINYVWYGYFYGFPLVKLIGHDIIYFIFNIFNISMLCLKL